MHEKKPPDFNERTTKKLKFGVTLQYTKLSRKYFNIVKTHYMM